MRVSLLIVVACGLLGACSSLLLGGSASGGPALGADSRTAAQVTEDNAITATIRSRYSADTALGAANLGVSTYQRTVTLSGTVKAFDVRDRAVQIARNTDKVRSVDNQIRVDTRR